MVNRRLTWFLVTNNILSSEQVPTFPQHIKAELVQTVTGIKCHSRIDYVSDSPHNEGLNQERIHVCNEIKARIPDLKVQRTQSSNNRETVDSGTLRHSRLRESKPLLSLDYVSDRAGLYYVPDTIAWQNTQPAWPLCNLQEEMEKSHLIRCPALKTTTETQRY
ncbi:unnamed protein product [Rodentolepis nana]|uniref:Uncharacterized protein n=1 Tax=Rodentolepis nana TaxID=102285 RepID=A0A0R3TCJ4_RODNA|nr:unnamed protein product [Rodentolepis nana]